MTAMDYIKSLDKDDFYIDKCKKKIERLETLAENRSSKPFDNDRIQSSGSKDRIGDISVRIVEEKGKLARLIARSEEKREYLERQIDVIDDLEQQKILYYRHITKMRYEDIGDMLDKSPQTIQNKHSKAMKELVRVFVIPQK